MVRRILIVVAAVFCLGLAAGAWAQATPPAETPPAPTAKPADLTKNTYRGGFKWGSEDGKFSLRLFSAVQFRYTYMAFDDDISGNQEDYSNFYMRRARLWWDGHAYDPNFTYAFHLQIEPQGAVNLHDAWVQYKFSDMLNLGLGRNKIPYGLEFLHSGFGLNFIDRSVMYGETDVDNGGGLSRYPGGGTGSFGLSSYNANTGFATGGINIYRSQGLSLSGLSQPEGGGAFEYQVGVWNGRDKRARSNEDTDMLWVARLGWHPFGYVNWLFQGDTKETEKLMLGMWAAAYTDGGTRTRNAQGQAVTPYDVTDSGYDLSMMMVYRGFSAEAEYGVESYEMDNPALVVNEFDRSGWRVQGGYFVVPKKIEVVARYAEIERLKDATAQLVVDSGLGFAQVLNPATGSFQAAMEDSISEITAGLNFYINAGHQHKLFFDVSQLTRSFQEYNGFTPSDQEDIRFRSMLQLKF